MQLNAQQKVGNATDTVVLFKVYGACDHCKMRIEKAAKLKGVKSTNWNRGSKMLTLVFKANKTSIEKIKKAIVESGHDLELQKASDAVYQSLPACCKYREVFKDSSTHDSSKASEAIKTPLPEIKSDTIVDTTLTVPKIKGIVLEETDNGKFIPLSHASVFWVGSSNGVVTNEAGVFYIDHHETQNSLVISYVGYMPDTLTVTDSKGLKIVLASAKHLKEVVLTSKQRSTYLSALDPIRTQVMTSKELLKAACCNLSESFETNPSVDVSYNDAVTGSKQIQLLGLSGNYTQLTVENLPGPRGIATPLGINSIAGPWIESIQLTKGVGSVANGFESIAGQINVELKKSDNSEKLLANAYVNNNGKIDLNLNLSKKFNGKWSAALLLHNAYFGNKQLDFNKDGFRDMPTGNTFSLVNRYKYDNGNGLLAQFGVKWLTDKKTGGETLFNAGTDKYTTNHYGLGIDVERVEAFGKIGYVFPQKKYKSIGLQLAAINHTQNSYFGLTAYDAKQKSFYGNLIYQSIIKSTEHKFRTGISFLYDNYNEMFKLLQYKRTETVPGVFAEYTFTPDTKFSAVVGMRADHNNLFGYFVTPRLNLRYQPVKGTTIRGSVGRGQRTANIFAENTSVFVSARQVNIIASGNGKAYGLNPEVAWNKGISIDQKFKLFNKEALFSADFFRNDFSNQVLVDVEDPGKVKFYNLQGNSFSNSFQAELSFEPIEKLETRLAYRLFDVKATYEEEKLQRPFIAKHRAFVNLAYSFNNWKMDYTITYNGKKRLPNTITNPDEYRLQSVSPDFLLMNMQVSKSFGKKFPMDVYAGAENFTNFFQKKVIVAANQPFSPYFDASMIWGPVNGRMLYVGWRMKIK